MECARMPNLQTGTLKPVSNDSSEPLRCPLLITSHYCASLVSRAAAVGSNLLVAHCLHLSLISSLFGVVKRAIRASNSPAQSRGKPRGSTQQAANTTPPFASSTLGESMDESLPSVEISSLTNELKQMLRNHSTAIIDACESKTFTKEHETIAKYIRPAFINFITNEVQNILGSRNFKNLERAARDHSIYPKKESPSSCKPNIENYRHQALRRRIEYLKYKVADGNAQINILMDRVYSIRDAIKEITADMDEI